MLENLKFVFYGDQFYVDNFWLMEYSQDISGYMRASWLKLLHYDM